MPVTLREQRLDWPGPIHRKSSLARAWWIQLSPLGRDITLVLLLKAILLVVLWWAFFREPAAPTPATDPQLVAQRLVAPNPAPEVRHADR
jgi:type II secretory pathway component PulM